MCNLSDLIFNETGVKVPTYNEGLLIIIFILISHLKTMLCSLNKLKVLLNPTGPYFDYSTQTQVILQGN